MRDFEFTTDYGDLKIDGEDAFWHKTSEMGQYYAFVVKNNYIYKFGNFGLWERNRIIDTFKFIDEKNCTKEGGERNFESEDENPACCEGLIEKPMYAEGECIPIADGAVCVDCPNGICGLGENECNCPEDCKND